MARGAPDWFPSINQVEEGMRVVVLPTRLTAGSARQLIVFEHGLVTADWDEDNTPTQTQSSTYNLYITELSLNTITDSTNEVQVQDIPLRVILKDYTAIAELWRATASIPNNTHFVFNSPYKIPKGHRFLTSVRLGGATDLNIEVVLNGFESVD